VSGYKYNNGQMSSEDLRSPAAKLAKAAYKRRGIKRPHDDDRERREFFAGLVACDKDHKYTAVQLMKLANDHYRAQKRPRLNTSTAQSWKRQCLNNMELFTAGPRYSHAGNPKLTDEDVQTVRDFVLDNPYEGERRHSAMLKAQEGINVSASWIRDLRNSEPVEEKIRPFKVQTKPAMTQQHRDKRVQFCTAQAHAVWPIWIFSDEYTISINGRRGLIYYARSRDDVPHLETHKYAATFHVFAAITRDGVLPLRYYDNSLNAENHCRILDHVFKDIETMRSGLPCVFQHDGAPYSNAKRTQEFLANHPLVLSGLIKPLKANEWPPSSPDLNIIENLMGTVKTEVLKRLAKLPKGTNITVDLWKQHLEAVWHSVPAKTIRNLYDSLPRRCEDCIARKGEPLKN